MKSFSHAFHNVADFLGSIVTGSIVATAAKEFLSSWDQSLGWSERKIQVVEMVEFITGFDVIKRLIEGHYCQLDR